MPIFRSIILSFGALSLAGGFYLNKQKVSLKNQYLRSTLSFLHNYVNFVLFWQNQKYPSFLLSLMIKFSMISRCQEVKNYVFSYGFDFDADYIDGLSEIGFDTIQFGPVSLMPAIKEEKRKHFGDKIAIGNINTFYEEKNKSLPQENKQNQKTQSKIGIAISPNYEVLKYAPYLIEDNITSCLKQCEQLNQISQNLSVDRYVIKLNEPDMIEMNSPQYVAMVQQLIKNVHQAMLQTLQKNKAAFPQSIGKLRRPQIFIQVPNSQENPQIFKTVQQMPLVQKMIIDGSQYEVTRSVQKINKKTVKNVIQLTVGKKRMTFQQLLDKVISDTL